MSVHENHVITTRNENSNLKRINKITKTDYQANLIGWKN